MMSSSELFRQIAVMRKEGRVDQAPRPCCGDALNRNGLTPEDIDRAGGFIHKARAATPAAKGTLQVQLLGQCTTNWLVPALTAIAWGQGQACSVAEGGYDNVLQDLNRLAALPPAPDVVVLIPWTQRLLAGSAPVDRRVEDELTFWRHAWDAAAAMGARVLQVGYDWISPGAEGFGLAGDPASAVDLVRAANAGLRARLRPSSSTSSTWNLSPA